MQQVGRDDVQFTQAVAAEHGEDVGGQLFERRADPAHHQGDQRYQQQCGATGTGQDDRNLFQPRIANAQQLLEGLAGGVAGGKQVFTAVLEQLGQQIEAGEYDEKPHQFVGDEPRERYVAGEQGEEGNRDRDAGEGIDHPGQRPPRFGGNARRDHVPAGFVNAQQQHGDHGRDDQCDQATDRDHQPRGHASDIGYLRQRHQHKQCQGQACGVGFDRQGERIGKGRQAP
ncbi:hypothetical protein D3C76_868170 [compost metagenome]